MHKSGPGKYYRKGISLAEAFERYGDEREAEKWFIERRWPNGIACPHCGSLNIKERASRKPMPFHCTDCRKYFSVKTGTVLQDSNLPISKWVIAFYLYSTNLKGVSSMKLSRDLGVTQKTAWHLAHRLREAFDFMEASEKFAGPVEVDETYIGGKEDNKHRSKKLHAGRGTVGKTAVAGVRDRNTGKVRVKVVQDTTKETLQGFVTGHTEEDAMVYSDDHLSYRGLPRRHETVAHNAKEYVRGLAHTNGIESFWAMFKRGYQGVYHKMSAKHLHRYAGEFAGRNNVRELDTEIQMEQMVGQLQGKRLRYNDLIGPVETRQPKVLPLE